MRFIAPALLVALLAAPVLDPAVQLYYRDTGRFQYPARQVIAERLARHELPFWNPWAESGESLTAQLDAGLWHPTQLFYLVLPFELAFKLQHLGALLLAVIGMYLLARRLACSREAALVAAVGFGGSGFLASMIGSNLLFALGLATVPLALERFLLYLRCGRPRTLLAAAFLLSCCAFAGDAQAMLLGGYLGLAFSIAAAFCSSPAARAAPPSAPAQPSSAQPASLSRARLRPLLRCAAWGACALLLSLPAVLPALPRFRMSARATGSFRLLDDFAMKPLRLAGLALPFAFDDDVEAGESGTYAQHLRGLEPDAFADCITLGAPLLLLAFFSRRRSLLAGALVFALGACGSALVLGRLIYWGVPGMQLFRYPEKLLGPASLLFSLAAAFGADRLRAGGTQGADAPRGAGDDGTGREGLPRGAGDAATVRAEESQGRDARGAGAGAQKRGGAEGASRARTFARIAFGAALLFALGALLCGDAWAGKLRLSCATEAALCALLGLAARRPAWLAPLCALSAYLSVRAAIPLAPLEVLRAPSALAADLERQRGPSEGRWRILTEGDGLFPMPGLDARLAQTFGGVRALLPSYNALAHVESAVPYSALLDLDYQRLFRAAPRAAALLFGVGFVLRPPQADLPPGYLRGPHGILEKQWPEEPRAFALRCAQVEPDAAALAHALAAPGFDPHRAAFVRKSVALPPSCASPAVPLDLRRPQPERMNLDSDLESPFIAVLAEHFEPGWHAQIDGRDAEVLQVDLAALGVVMPAGAHHLELRFQPPGLAAGLAVALLCALALLALDLRQRRA